MAHKKVDARVFEQIDRAIEAHRKAIHSAGVYREDAARESIKDLLEGLKSLLEVTREKKDNALLLSSEEGANFARVLLGRQKAYEEIISSFEDAESYEKYHRGEIEKLELERKEFEQYPIAD